MKRQKIYTRKIHIWLSEEQFNNLDDESKILGIAKIDILRKYITRKSIYSKFYTTIDYKIKKIGDLLNQIARHCNTAKKYDEPLVEKYIKEKLDEIKARQDELTEFYRDFKI